MLLSFRRLPAFLFLLSLSLLATSTPAAAQVVDSLGPDSTAADTVDQTARYLKAQEASTITLPVPPLAGRTGPYAARGRMVLTQDSILWTNAETLGDLLQEVPGVFLWRGGWFGQPEYVNYRGRGTASVEYWLDGLLLPALGPDSLAFDPATMALSFLDRVEIEQLPGRLRVYLYTRRNDRLSARSRIGVSTGDRSVARYYGALERRFRSGLGFTGAFDYLSAPTGSGYSSDYSNLMYWLQAGWQPSPGFGLEAQSVRMSPDRAPFLRAPGDTIGTGVKGKREDDQVRLFWGRAAQAPGARLDLLFGHSRWQGEGITQTLDQGSARISWRTVRTSVAGSATWRSRWTPWDFRADAGVALPGGLSLDGEAALLRHDHSRSSRWLSGHASLALPLGVILSGGGRVGREVAQPSLAADTAQRVASYEGSFGIERSWLGVEVGLTRTSAFAPRVYQPYLLVDHFQSLADRSWVTASVRLRPVQWLTLESWYSDPTGQGVNGMPPTHSYSTATIRSRFLHDFPSGIFDLKLQLAMDAWSDGVVGFDAGGNPIKLGGATFFRSLIEIRLAGLVLFWDRLNLSAARRSYIPEYPLPRAGSTYGVRWEFMN